MFLQKNSITRAIWALLFLILLFLRNPLWTDHIHNDHIIEKSNYISDIFKSNSSSKSWNTDIININDQILEEIQNYEELHWAPEDWSNKFTNACNERSSLCNKVSYSNITDQNKYYYQSIINLLFARLDSYSKLSVSDTIKSIIINWESSGRRWYAWRTKIYINPKDISSYMEFLEVFTHEAGHVVDLWVIKWSASQLDSNYTEFGDPSFATNDPSLSFYKISRSNENTTHKSSSYKDFVSWYGMSNPFEDFAECQNMYLNHKDTFAKMAESSANLKAKYSFLESIYNSKYIQNDDKTTNKVIKNSTRRPRDTTRIR